MTNADKIRTFEDYASRMPGPPKRARLTPEFVWIIEWLNPCDRKTGLELHDWLQTKRKGWSKYVPCRSRAEVFLAINRVTNLSEKINRIPILHMETHGSAEGIGAVNDAGESEGIYWEELTAALQALNIATRCNLIWFMVACDGIAAIKALSTGPRAPVAVLAGPDRAISESDAFAATKEFYRSLMQGEENFTSLIDNATREMRDAVIEPEPFVVLAFESVVREIALGLRQGIWPNEELFQQRWDTMFMIDLFPENRDRFGLNVRELLIAMQRDEETRTIWLE